MRNYSKLSLLLLATALIAISTGLAIRQSQSNVVSASPAQEQADGSEAPVLDVNAPDSTDPKKKEKAKKYNRKVSAVDPLLVQTVEVYHWPKDFPPLPSDQSKLVVIGEVTEAKAYLSADKTGVYSEFTIRIEQVLKNSSGLTLEENSSIVAERMGGRVKYPSGHISRYFVAGQRMPREKRRYVLFLTTEDGDEDLYILTGYELRAGRVYPLDSATTVNFDAYNGAGESTYINELRASISISAKK